MRLLLNSIFGRPKVGQMIRITISLTWIVNQILRAHVTRLVPQYNITIKQYYDIFEGGYNYFNCQLFQFTKMLFFLHYYSYYEGLNKFVEQKTWPAKEDKKGIINLCLPVGCYYICTARIMREVREHMKVRLQKSYLLVT